MRETTHGAASEFQRKKVLTPEHADQWAASLRIVATNAYNDPSGQTPRVVRKLRFDHVCGVKRSLTPATASTNGKVICAKMSL